SIFSTLSTWPPVAPWSTTTRSSPKRAPIRPAVSPARPAPTITRSCVCAAIALRDHKIRSVHMTYTPALDVDALLAIDIHVHAGVSGTGPRAEAPQAGRNDTLARQTQRTGAGGQTPDETAAYYRERKIAAAIWGIDPLATGGTRPGFVSNDE